MGMVHLSLHRNSLQKLRELYDGRNESLSSCSSTGASTEVGSVVSCLRRVLGEEDQLAEKDSKGEVSLLPLGVVDHEELVKITRTFAGVTSLDQLVRGAQLWFPPKKAFVRSPELEATLARIRLEQERSSYQAMISPYSTLHPTPAAGSSSVFDQRQEEMQWQEIRSQISAMANISLSGAAVGIATWWSSGRWTPLEVKVLLTAAASLGIILIEAFLYSRHFERTRRRKEAAALGLRGNLTKGVQVLDDESRKEIKDEDDT